MTGDVDKSTSHIPVATPYREFIVSPRNPNVARVSSPAPETGQGATVIGDAPSLGSSCHAVNSHQRWNGAFCDQPVRIRTPMADMAGLTGWK